MSSEEKFICQKAWEAEIKNISPWFGNESYVHGLTVKGDICDECKKVIKQIKKEKKMSIENELKRIADTLERITTPTEPKLAVNTAPTPGGAPDLMPATTKGRGKGKNTAPPAAAPAVTPEPPKPEVSKADITSTLQGFLKMFPGPEGAEKARVFFTNAGAKNITTLDPLKYKEVFLGLQQAMK